MITHEKEEPDMASDPTPQRPPEAENARPVHTAAIDQHTGLTACCGVDPRTLRDDAFSYDEPAVTCDGVTYRDTPHRPRKDES